MPTLMISISGIRGIVGDGLEPDLLVKYTSAYADFVKEGIVVIGNDGRISGEMVNSIVVGTLLAKGIDVIDLGICPTPTVQFNVKNLNAAGGIAISASHNPNEWNALKLLNSSGQFMTPDENIELNKIVASAKNKFKSWDKLGKHNVFREGLVFHKNEAMKLKCIDSEKIKKRKFKVLVDCVNGAGVHVIPQMLRELGCNVVELNCERSGIFPRLPEPIPENLQLTMKAVVNSKADLGIVVDPDVDRLVLITEKGEPFGEENTIVQAVKFILSKQKGDVVVNLSTTRAVDDIANSFGCKVFRSPVGEANVVQKMKETNAIIGGEGSGGVIFPELHYGRDALVGILITLQHLVDFGAPISELKKSLPQYFITKKKIDLGSAKPDEVIGKIISDYAYMPINTDDGLRIDFEDHWVHFRKSNTEPIIRCICEAVSQEKAAAYIEKYFNEVKAKFI
ncbi:MAG: phosphoglucosamine mutase [Chlorobiaceae bacterium]|nr:phosphoglucosamine mutase [Chlorobiaceae bacterium]MBA4309588.1 phosphoglucosamine mutase [Chlorobiaceae bacterium]